MYLEYMYEKIHWIKIVYHSASMYHKYMHENILSRATFPWAPSYGSVRTWVEGSQTRGDRTLDEASNILGYKEYTQQDFTTNIWDTIRRAIKLPTNARYTPYSILTSIENKWGWVATIYWTENCIEKRPWWINDGILLFLYELVMQFSHQRIKA